MAAERLGGASACCAHHGLKPPLLFDIPTAEQAASLAPEDRLQEWVSDGITAVACFNDIFAARVLQATRRLNFAVPGQLALIGCDDEIIAALGEPALTSVRFDVDAMAQDLIEQSLAILDGNEPASPSRRQVELVVRAST